MKRFERERVEQIYNLWLEYQANSEEQERIINEGPTHEGKLAEFAGDMPDASSFKPEIQGFKADRLKRYEHTKEQKQAYEMIMLLSANTRLVGFIHFSLRNAIDPETKQRFKLEKIALFCGLTVEAFKEKRAAAWFKLIELDKTLNHNIYERKETKKQYIAV